MQHSDADDQRLIELIKNSVQDCGGLIHELQEEYGKFNGHSSHGFKSTLKVAGHRISYPFQQGTLQKLNKRIEETRANLSSAIETLRLKDNRDYQNDIVGIQAVTDLVRTDQISWQLCDWLKAPDASINYNEACNNRHPGTGHWLVENPQFLSWLTARNSFMWLNGFTGSGMSVLCSRAIQIVERRRRSDLGVGVAFFYFTVTDESK